MSEKTWTERALQVVHRRMDEKTTGHFDRLTQETDTPLRYLRLVEWLHSRLARGSQDSEEDA